jgi:hypothetical protein
MQFFRATKLKCFAAYPKDEAPAAYKDFDAVRDSVRLGFCFAREHRCQPGLSQA